MDDDISNKFDVVKISSHGESNYQTTAMVLTEAKMAGFNTISFIDIEKFLE